MDDSDVDDAVTDDAAAAGWVVSCSGIADTSDKDAVAAAAGAGSACWLLSSTDLQHNNSGFI